MQGSVMAGSVNKVILIGNLGKDPEIRATQDGREIASFSIATSDTWKDKIVLFNEGLVKVAKNYLKKGAKVYIEGQLQTRKWTDQQGVDKYTTEVVLQNYNGTLTMLDGRREDGGSSGGYNDGYSGGGNQYSAPSNQSQGSRNAAPAPELDDEIPF
jgi:single-strand DNA-binding protein